MKSSAPVALPDQERPSIRAYGLHCICGNDEVFFSTGTYQDYPFLQLYCPLCGIIMRAPQIEGEDNRAWLYEHWKNTHGKRLRPSSLRPWQRRKDSVFHGCPHCTGEAPRNTHGEEVLSAYCPHCGQPLGY